MISPALNQTVTYWGPMIPGEFGTDPTWPDPVVLKARWQEGSRLVRDQTGAEVVSSATVYLETEVEYDSRLLLGESQEATPPATARAPIAIERMVDLSGITVGWKVAV